jgi:hypothetical protein
MNNPATTTTASTPTNPSLRADPVAALRRRWPTWVGLAVTAASVALLAPLPGPARAWVSAWCVLAAAVIYFAWGTARGDLDQRTWLTAQTAGVLGFGATAIAAVAVAPDLTRYVLAAGWLAHAAWDVIHHRADRVVPRWYAETCMVIDLCVAAVLLTVGLV